ncbi:hypothetical protein AXF42_Ash013669 [Apostasia shenzhenica]|uniref:Uncharacterized protein n=1 Tax=Apostasia shenzhenica TaxID=1088818 RepID=A0A2I0APJ6_9ASPA|nr:hypothetical protein AXF42_Ash013669 [Apostasia shenzhenica]
MKLASRPSFPRAAAYVALIISVRSVDLQEEGDASTATVVAICRKKLTQPPATRIHSATRSKQSQQFPPSLQITSASRSRKRHPAPASVSPSWFPFALLLKP